MSATASPGDAFCPTCEASFAPGTARCPTDGTALVTLHTPADPMLGRDLDGRYTLKKKLGEGGMGAVYRALQHSVGREVAVKVMSGKLASEPLAVKRFLREAKLSSRLTHPGVVTVLDFGQTPDGLLYMAMELLPGRTLENLMQETRLTVPRACRLTAQVLDALAAAHALQIVHRDLKPSNVMLLDDPSGRDLVKVLDFGVARSLAGDLSTATGSGQLLGTPAYVSPEAVRGDVIDARSDLYSLGVMLYEMLAGRRPYRADSVPSMLIAHLEGKPEPLPPTVPAVVVALVERMMAKQPGDRHASALAARAAIEALLELPHVTSAGVASAIVPNLGGAAAVDPVGGTLAAVDPVGGTLAAASPKREPSPITITNTGAGARPSPSPSPSPSPAEKLDHTQTGSLQLAASAAATPARDFAAPPRSRAPLWIAVVAVGATAATLGAWRLAGSRGGRAQQPVVTLAADAGATLAAGPDAAVNAAAPADAGAPDSAVATAPMRPDAGKAPRSSRDGGRPTPRPTPSTTSPSPSATTSPSPSPTTSPSPSGPLGPDENNPLRGGATPK